MTVEDRHRRTIARILKVNHAGECGAIRIYQAQLFVMRVLYRDLAPKFRELLTHEKHHCRKFRAAMPPRGARPCRAMWLWGAGGFVLGLMTALLGRNAIFACTEAIEKTVHSHMTEQIAFLQGRDGELAQLITGVLAEEVEHLRYAESNHRRDAVSGLLDRVIGFSTDGVIWLSTQGDSSRMKAELKAAA